MYINITLETVGRRFDLSIDERGSASAVYDILLERGMAEGPAPVRYRSMLLGEWIDAKQPLANQGVVSGDLLTAQI